MEDLSDEDADPTYTPTPRINVFQEAEESDDEGDAGDFEEPTVASQPAAAIPVQPTFTWKTQNVFDPLPPAPPFDDISDPQF